MRYPIYSRVRRLRTAVLAATLTALTAAPISASNADVQAGIDAARSGNFNMAHTEFLREAKLGNPHAQALPGELYHMGRGVEQSYAQAASWYHQAAARGHVAAQYILGDYDRRGLGVERDVSQAFQWYQRAADQNLAPAQYAVAIRYRDGIGVEADQEAATTWLEKAARQGLSPAQINLGIRYRRGNHVPRDKILACAWMRRAAGQGDMSTVQTLKELKNGISEKDVPSARDLSLTLN